MVGCLLSLKHEESSYKTLVLDTHEKIKDYIICLSEYDHATLSLYWTLYENRQLNAYYFVEHFPSTSKIFRTKKRLWSTFPGYERRRWNYIRRMLIILQVHNFISIKPIENSPPIAVQPNRKFETADYLIKPLISQLVLKFAKKGSILTLDNVIAIHKFLRVFLAKPHVKKQRGKKVLKKVLAYSDNQIVKFLFPL